MATSEGGNVLIVDDEADLRSLLGQIVTRHLPGVTVRLAPSADEAIRLLQEWPADLLITDYHMPGRDGVYLVNAARGFLPKLRAIVLTGSPDRFSVGSAEERPPWTVLSKPVDPDLFVKIVRGLLPKAAR